MSGNKIKSLRLRRSDQRSQTPSTYEADQSMILAEETKTHVERIELSSRTNESSTPLHSTPKKSGEKSNSAQDPGEIDYRVSPIFLPCTQDGGTDVGWDWDSPRAKAKLKKSRDAESVRTPKRTTMLQKKRNSNSPLLYKPIKRKLMPSNQESIDLFTAELKAISEQVKTAPRGNDDVVAGRRPNEPEDELLVEVDLGDIAEAAADESSRPKNGETVVTARTSMDDLFDDSIEDCMVKCSQEVEEKLRLESSKRNSDTSASGKDSPPSWHRNSYSRSLATKDKTPNDAGTSSRSPSSSFTAKNPPTCKAKSSTEMSPRSIPRSSNFSTANFSGEARASPRINNLKLSRILTKSRATKLSGQSSNESKSTSTISGQPKLPPVTSNQTKLTCGTSNQSKSTSVISSQSKSVASYQPKSSCINNNVTAKPGKTAPDATPATQTEIFEIPDDSFDDFIAVCCDEPENTSEKSERRESSGRYGKVYVSPHWAGSSENPRRFDGSRARKVLLPPPSQSSASLAKSSTSGASGSAGKIFTRTASNDSLRTSGKSSVESPSSMTTMTTMTTSTTNQGRKFFKTKSLSTSSFDEHANAKNTSGTANNSSLSARGWKSSMFANGGSNSCVSSDHRKTSILLDYNEIPSRENGSGSVVVNSIGVNVDRNGPRGVDSLRSASEKSRANGKSQQQRSTTGGTQSATRCTPEEIERKRLEARMKLEAKKKLMARSASSGSLPASGNAKGFVKR